MTTGYVSGVFDMFHVGHLNIILQARKRCDRLIVGVVDDEVVRTSKHKDPVIPLPERLSIVAALDGVDEVFVDRHVDKFDTWKELHYDVIFKGDDWKDAPKGRKLEADLATVGARVEYFPYTKHTSSTLLREVLTTLAATPVELAPPSGESLTDFVTPTTEAEALPDVPAVQVRGDVHVHTDNGAPSVLVTGGAGFVGSTVVKHLLDRTSSHAVILDKLTYAGDPHMLAELPAGRHDLVIGDVADEDLVNELVSQVDQVIHLAGESHNDQALVDPSPFVATNVVGTFRLLEAVRRYGVRFHHASTVEVYGAADRKMERAAEDTPYRPATPHAASKAGADHLVRAWVQTFGVQATISHSSNNYGPYQHVEKFIPRQITHILDGRPPRLYGDGTYRHDWVHVSDHADAILRILTDGEIGSSYVVASGKGRRNSQVLAMILELMGRPTDDVVHVNDRGIHPLYSRFDAHRLRDELGWRPRYDDLRTGLAETIDWYRTHEDWWRDRRGQSEAWYAAQGEQPIDLSRV